MIRYITQQLVKWKDIPSRMPLLLRGARQTGKSYIVEDFGTHYFDNLVTINFELNPEFKFSFRSLNPTQILQELHALTRQPIVPGKTLLFLDEIQECPQAIQSLRYFKEQIPALHVISAGSLLEFALDGDKFKMPVGRVEFLYLYPMNFIEFLYALKEDALVDMIRHASFNQQFSLAVHERCLELLRLYIIIGGMPGVVKSYIQENDLQRCQSLQINLLATFRNDFGKYANLAQQPYCQLLFNKMPDLASRHFKYVDVDPTADNRGLKTALNLLIKAGLITLVKQTSASGLPLNANINEKRFKLLFLDVGLIKAAGKLDIDILLNNNLMDIRTGAISEQFIGQSLLTIQPGYDQADLFYWQRDKKGSEAEVDYLITYKENIIPIEVKSGSTGRLRSLQLFMEEKEIPLGVCMSTNELRKEKNIAFIPLYMLSEITRLITE